MKTTVRRNKYHKTAVAVACILSLSFLTSGCMPYKELKQLSIVEGVGIDADNSGGLLVTFQIYNPEQGGGGGGGSDKKSSSSQVKILQSSGNSIFDAVRNATLQVGRELYFSNNRAYILGQNVCNTDITPLLDFMERNQQIKPTEHLYVAQGKAADILMYKKDDEYVPAVNLELISQNSADTSKTLNVQLIDVFRSTSNQISDLALPLVSLHSQGDEQLLLVDGTAVFHNSKLAGFLNEPETRGYLWITGKAHGGVVQVQLPNGGTANLEILKESSKIKMDSSKGTLSAKVKMKVDSNLIEVHSKTNVVIDDSFIGQLKTLQSSIIKAEAQYAVNKSLGTYKADIFDFGLKTYENLPDTWRKISKEWKTGNKPVTVTYEVDSSINHTGLVTQAS